ncbi:MAG: glucuronate isomerase [Shewanella sp.]
MKAFMCEDFLLNNETAKHLYHVYAKDLPIVDYHCHLDPSLIANDQQFDNLAQVWLTGDHYKWRAMRAAGIDESLITGDTTSDHDKFMAWAQTVPQTLGNPLFHWTHLELRRPFGISGQLLNPRTAQGIWDETRALLSQSDFSARGIMRQMNVKMVGTTDDPIDSLLHHKVIAEDKSFDVIVSPSWRPDRAFKIDHSGFRDYLNLLSEAASQSIDSFSDLLAALSTRLEHFDQHGCRSADHGIEVVHYADIPSQTILDSILQHRIKGASLTDLEVAQFSTAVQVWLGKQYSRLGWVMQLHIGAQRNNNTRMFKLLGGDAGFDSIGDQLIAYPLSKLLDAMDLSNELPKTILYCLNPRDNEVLATMIGNFQGGVPGKIQFGSGWWFNDQKDGMQRQIEQLSQLGLLSQFVGMLTDSRSLLSYTRHEYFRRILCNMVGTWAENGEVPNDIDMLSNLIERICYKNANSYFNLDGQS